LAIALTWPHAVAQPSAGERSFPNRPVRLIVPFPPGGGTDLVARSITPRLSERLGQQVIIDNRGGASGNIAFETTARAVPDGYTLLVVSNSYATNAALAPKLSFDPVRDLRGVSLLGLAPLVLTANPALPAKSIPELIALARARPGQLKYASSGNGTGPHLAGELLKYSARIDMLHVPYKGSGPALIDTLSGQVELTFLAVLVARPHVTAGRLRLLGVGTPHRVKALADTPAIAETIPGFVSTSWYAILGPAALPASLAERLSREFAATIKSTDVAERLSADAIEPLGGGPAVTSKHVAAEIERWGAVARNAGVRAE
jgi:tripartite-type tricarboxylate transporter receptor subunit TctC